MPPHFTMCAKEGTKTQRWPKLPYEMRKEKSSLHQSSAGASSPSLWGRQDRDTQRKAPLPQRRHTSFLSDRKKSAPKEFKIALLMCLLTTSLSQREFFMPFNCYHQIRHLWLWPCPRATISWELPMIKQGNLNKYNIYVFVTQNHDDLVRGCLYRQWTIWKMPLSVAF